MMTALLSREKEKVTKDTFTFNSWYNYREQAYETRDAPTTDKEALTLIPQDPSAVGLYRCYRMLELDILGSMANTLSACVGQEALIPIPEP